MIVVPAYLCVFWLKVPHSNTQYCRFALADDIFSRCLYSIPSAFQAEGLIRIRMVGVCSRAQSLLGT